MRRPRFSCDRAGGWRARLAVLPAVLALTLTLTLTLTLAACNIGVGSFTPFGATSTSNGVTTVHLQVLHGSDGSTLLLLPVTIDGHGPYKFALDTGASVSIVNATIARQLGLPVAGQAQRIAGVGGNEIALPVRVSDWKAGGLVLPPATISSGQLPSSRRGNGLQGLLGSDIWNQFGKITIDYSAGTITVYKQFTTSTSGS